MRTRTTPFQFHKGTIKTYLDVRGVPDGGYFNSIKVRLKHDAMPEIKAIGTFQFHKGTIKTTQTEES